MKFNDFEKKAFNQKDRKTDDLITVEKRKTGGAGSGPSTDLKNKIKQNNNLIIEASLEMAKQAQENITGGFRGQENLITMTEELAKIRRRLQILKGQDDYQPEKDQELLKLQEQNLQILAEVKDKQGIKVRAHINQELNKARKDLKMLEQKQAEQQKKHTQSAREKVEQVYEKQKQSGQEHSAHRKKYGEFGSATKPKKKGLLSRIFGR